MLNFTELFFFQSNEQKTWTASRQIWIQSKIDEFKAHLNVTETLVVPFCRKLLSILSLKKQGLVKD